MDPEEKTFKTRVSKNLKRNRVIDNLIYKISGKTAIYESVQFKFWLILNKTKYISNLNPIIIGGCPRSGTTLIRALIGMHPNIAAPKREYNLLIGLKNDDILHNILNFNLEEISELKNKSRNMVNFSENVLKLYTKKQGKNNIVVKQPFHILIINELFKYFPKMKFIHIIRDGRDVACSLRLHPKWKYVNGKNIPTNKINPFDWCIRRWVTCINLGKKWRESDNYIEIKYENVVNYPVETMKEIFQFINVENIPKNDLLSFYKYEKDEDHFQNIEVGREIYQKSIGRWKKDMIKDEIQMFKRMAGEQLIELNYADHMNW